MRRPLRGFLTTLTLLVLAACATQTAPPKAQLSSETSYDPQFPAPPELQPQIAFWRNVYASWGRGQVALHDDRYMDLIYDVITLPEPVSEGYTSEQKALLKARFDGLEEQLRQVERKVATQAPLSPSEQALATRIQASSGGPAAISGVSERLRSQRGLRERFKRGLEISGRYDAAFRQVFREAGLPEDLAYLPHVESSFQNHAASSVGAVGMWQFMPATARQFMIMNAAVDERLDPVASAQGAARYLGNAHGRLGSWPLAITSYNHGVGGMRRAQSTYGNDIGRIVQQHSGSGFGFASRNFYTEFLAAREIARNPQRFFPEGVAFEPPLNLDRVRLRQSVPATTVASYYQVNLSELNSLNRAWKPAAKSASIPLPAGVMVWLPNGTLTRLAQRGSVERALALLADPVPATR
jgi:membrane-bound lytic murein transglycosylase D